MAWYVDEGLAALIAEWKAAHPGCTVYTIADQNHSQDPDVSQHAPDDGGSQAGDDKGEVDAADFMIGKGVTAAELEELFDGLTRGRDPRLFYVIYNKRIVSAVTQPWAVRPYSGSDPHTNHVHVSVNDRFDDNTSDWHWEKLVARTIVWESAGEVRLPLLQLGDDDDAMEGYNRIGRFQVLANWMDHTIPDVDPDGVYGPKTAAKFKAIFGGDGKKLAMEHMKRLLAIG